MSVDAVIGPLFDTSLHEFGHALFDMLKLPVFGREEDAADQVSSYIILQLGKAESRRLIMGTAFAYKTEAEGAAAPPSLKQFADEHGTPAQCAYNVLCIAYGADSKLFGDFARYLPKKRADVCEDEYLQVERAFEKLIRPHIDRARAKGILDRSWLPEKATRLQRRPSSPRPNQ